MSTPPFPEMDELLQRLLNDDVEPDEIEGLRRAIVENPEVRDYYIDSMFVSAMIRRSSQVTGEICDSELIEALSGEDGQTCSDRPLPRLYAAAAVLVFGVLILASAFLLRSHRQGPELGQLIGVYGAQWQASTLRPGQPLHAGRYDLREGVAEIDLGQGATLLIEAPCVIELKHTDEVLLESGQLTAMVSPQAKGFRVQTSTAVITDLGTEFGVIVHPDGHTEAHVLKGSVSIALDPSKSDRPTPLVVTERHAAVIDARGQSVRGGLTAHANLFLHQLPSDNQPTGPTNRLNLADIVGGGSGRGTGKFDCGIELRTGRAFQYPATEIRGTRRNEFHPTPQFRGVDGVFVPSGARGPVVISSTGLVFEECPATVGSYHSSPSNTGKFFDLPTQKTYSARLNGVRFGTPDHPALNLHPNAGITFDLDQIRQDNPDILIDRFTAVCGIPKGLPQPQFSPAEVWVLLDGIVCFDLDYPVDQNAVEQIDIAIPAEARFLTLVTTCSGDADYSWILFGDPFIGPTLGE